MTGYESSRAIEGVSLAGIGWGREDGVSSIAAEGVELRKPYGREQETMKGDSHPEKHK